MSNISTTPTTEKDIAYNLRDTMPKISQMTFGVEIECFMPQSLIDSSGVNVGGYHRGIDAPSNFPTYNGEVITTNKWNLQRDSSIYTRAANKRGVEVVSPPMKGDSGLKAVYDMMKFLSDNDCSVNRSTGLHIHVGLQSVTKKAKADDVVAFLAQLNKYVFNMQYGLYAQTGTNRDAGRWCAPIRRSDSSIASLITAENKPKGQKTLADFANVTGNATRYKGINITNLNRGMDAPTSTIEFRFPAGTLNFDKVMCHILSIGFLIRLAWKNRHVKRDAMTWQLNKPYHRDENNKGVKTYKALISKITKSKAGRLMFVDSAMCKAFADQAIAKGAEMAVKYDNR